MLLLGMLQKIGWPVSIRRQLTSFGIIGALNTLITAITITVLTFAGLHPVLCNIAGFGLGLVNSFVMNKRFTFKATRDNSLLPFLVSFGVAYGLNLVVLILSAPLGAIHTLVPQAAGMITYNIIFFLLMKLWVFAGAAEPTQLQR